jgi:hypothetical protein
MGMPKKLQSTIRKCAERQGCDVQSRTGGQLRIKSPGGAVITVHSSPSSVENYTRDLRKKFEKAGLTPWP